jgi:hypothetical protein
MLFFLSAMMIQKKMKLHNHLILSPDFHMRLVSLVDLFSL